MHKFPGDLNSKSHSNDLSKSIINGLDRFPRQVSVQCLHFLNIHSLLSPLQYDLVPQCRSAIFLINNNSIFVDDSKDIILVFPQNRCPQSITFSFVLVSPTLSWFSSSLSGHSFFLDFSNSLPFAAHTLASLTSFLVPLCHTIFWFFVLECLCLKQVLLLSWQLLCQSYIILILVLNLNTISSGKISYTYPQH